MVDKLIPGNIEKAKADMDSDRARRINSLHKSVDESVSKQNKKTLQVSTEVNSLTREQQKLMKQIEAENLNFTNETAEAYNGVIRSLGKTVQNLSVGVKNITLDTAKATSGAIGQYGKAISEDINLNKRNTIAMSLAQSTPLLGYFASKVLETQAFQDLSGKMREKISNIGSAAFNKIKGKRKREEDFDEYEIPKMQKGGYVKKKGIVEVHAAEIVTPVDKILKKIEHAKTEDNTHKLQTALNTMTTTVVEMEDFQEKSQNKIQQILSTFIDEYIHGPEREQQGTWQEKMLKTLEELKVGTLGTAGRFEIAMRRTMLKHPAFKAMLTLQDIFRVAFVSPFRALFGLRGGFASDIKRATSTSSIFKQQVNLLALIYMNGMKYLRDITHYTKTMAESLTGGEVEGKKDETYTIFGKIKDFMSGKRPKEKTMFEKFSGKIGLDEDTLKEAGISSFGQLFSPVNLLRSMGVTPKNIKGIFKRKSKEEIINEVKEKATEVKDIATPSVAKVATGVKSIFKTKKEEPIIVSKSRKDKKEEATRGSRLQETIDKVKKYGQFQSEKLGKIASRGKSLGDKIKTWIPVILGIFMKILKPITFMAGILKNIFVSFTSFAGKMTMKTLGTAGKTLAGFGKGTKAAYAKKGVMGALGYGTKTGLKVAGRLAGGVGGLAVGGFMSAMDMYNAITNPGEFAGGILTRAFSAFFGGAGEAGKGGIPGLKRGMLKGGALGAGIGSFIPGFGTLLGGAIGALAGGILGFIGGENISKGLVFLQEQAKKLIKAIWGLVTFPIRMIWKGLKFLGETFNNINDKLAKWGESLRESIREKLSSIPLIGRFFAKKEAPSEAKKGGPTPPVPKETPQQTPRRMSEYQKHLRTKARIAQMVADKHGSYQDKETGLWYFARPKQQAPPKVMDVSDAYTRTANLKVMDVSSEYNKTLTEDAKKNIKGGQNIEVAQANIGIATLGKLEEINKTLEKSSEESTNATMLSSVNLSTTVSNAISNNRVNNQGGGGGNSHFSNAQNRANAVASANIM